MDNDIQKTIALNIEHLTINSDQNPFLPPNRSSPSQQSNRSLFSSSPSLEPPSQISNPFSPSIPQSLLIDSPLPRVTTRFLQIVSIKMKHGNFLIQELFFAFPLAIRIWAGVSSFGGAAARLDFKTAAIAEQVLDKHGRYGQSCQLGEYYLDAELESNEDEWWKQKGAQSWQGIRYSRETQNRM